MVRGGTARQHPAARTRRCLCFRQIMNHAISRGHIETNPTRGLKRNPRPKLTRFLSREEIGRLHEVLDGYEPRRPSRKAQADIIRLLLLTGCRIGRDVEAAVAGSGWRHPSSSRTARPARDRCC